MEEGNWAARVASEIASARAAIAANYLALWRKTGQAAPTEEGPQPTAPPPQDSVAAPASPFPGSREPDAQ